MKKKQLYLCTEQLGGSEEVVSGYLGDDQKSASTFSMVDIQEAGPSYKCKL